MKTTLTRKTIALLIAGAFLIATILVLPLFIRILVRRMGNRESGEGEQSQTTTLTRKSPTGAAEIYLRNLMGQTAEKKTEALGIEDPLFVGYEVIETNGNEQSAQVVAKAYIVNSYTIVTLDLVRNNDVWEPQTLATDKVLFYEKDNVRITHGQGWEFYLGSFSEDITESWVARHKYSDAEIIFFAELANGPYSTLFRECNEEGVENCQTEVVGDKEVLSATYYDVIKVYVIPETGEIGGGRNVVVMGDAEVFTAMKEEVMPMIETIEFLQ
jgi:hypothetical protein